MPAECDAAQALSRADAALYAAKKKGRGRTALFTPEIAEANRRRIAIERALMSGHIGEQIGLSFQPIFDLATGQLRAFEALARWTDPELGLVDPSEFIPIAEQINVIEAISDTLLARATIEAAHWPDAVRLSFNLSAVQLCSPGSAERLLCIVRRHEFDPGRLQIEVTETAMLGDFAMARLNLEQLRAAGARVLLDDFGSGFASISYLREMIFDAIKLDGTLVRSVPESDVAVRLLQGVLSLCASLRVPCVAEHIETQAQLDLLRELGCRDGQGFALGVPMDAAEARLIRGSEGHSIRNAAHRLGLVHTSFSRDHVILSHLPCGEEDVMRFVGMLSMTALILTGLSPAPIGPAPAEAQGAARTRRPPPPGNDPDARCAPFLQGGGEYDDVRGGYGRGRAGGLVSNRRSWRRPPRRPRRSSTARQRRRARSSRCQQLRARAGQRGPHGRNGRADREPQYPPALHRPRPRIANAMPGARLPRCWRWPTSRSRPSRSMSTPAPIPTSGGC